MLEYPSKRRGNRLTMASLSIRNKLAAAIGYNSGKDYVILMTYFDGYTEISLEKLLIEIKKQKVEEKENIFLECKMEK